MKKLTQNEKKKFKFYSTEHEGHILLALKLFDENKIFGIVFFTLN